MNQERGRACRRSSSPLLLGGAGVLMEEERELPDGLRGEDEESGALLNAPPPVKIIRQYNPTPSFARGNYLDNN